MWPLTNEKYISLATYRKNGTAVATPVWFAEDGERLLVLTGGDSWKVKRLRNSARSRIAACDVRGNVHGEWIETETTILENPADGRHVRRLLLAKYGLYARFLDFFAWLGRRIDKRAYLEVRRAP